MDSSDVPSPKTPIKLMRRTPVSGELPESTYITKDSGERVEYPTGAHRDVDDDKPRYDLIPPMALKRLAELYARGAVKYGDSNWQKGIPIDRYYGSAFRHLIQWASGETDEDHLAAVLFNVIGIMWTEDAIKTGNLPPDLAPVPAEFHK